MTRPTLALSIMQPWAWLIVHGWKRVENRSWRTGVRGPIFVHAGQKIDGPAHQCLLRGDHPADPFGDLDDAIRLAYQADLIAGRVPRGGIVGTVTIADCLNDIPSPWFVGPHGFLLVDPRPLPFLPMPGRLSFFPAYHPAA